MILKWADVLNLAKARNPAPDHKVVKSDAEWERSTLCLAGHGPDRR
jgi:hypothetical protein